MFIELHEFVGKDPLPVETMTLTQFIEANDLAYEDPAQIAALVEDLVISGRHTPDQGMPSDPDDPLTYIAIVKMNGVTIGSRS